MKLTSGNDGLAEEEEEEERGGGGVGWHCKQQIGARVCVCVCLCVSVCVCVCLCAIQVKRAGSRSPQTCRCFRSCDHPDSKIADGKHTHTLIHTYTLTHTKIEAGLEG